jgi:2-iminobutanoate/2-iminopropanoate deaminase
MVRNVVTRSAALAALLCVTPLSAVSTEIAKYDEGPFSGPYSESARVGDLLFLAGQVGEYQDGKLVSGGISAEAEQVMLNIKAALARRGLGLEHVVKCTVFLVDVAEWSAFNEIYKKHFSEPYPARTAIGVSKLVLSARVEVECVAGYP